MKFSLIVPFYNVEPYIEHCLRSLWLQDFPKEDYEIIAVNDCSPDKSDEIVKSLIPQISNLRIVYHQKNLGLGGARNTGIKSAKGDYLFFIDSDDCWIRNDVLSTFSKIIETYHPTVVRSLIWQNFPHDSHIQLRSTPTPTINTIQYNSLDYFLSETFFYNVWTSCYKRQFILDNGLFFREKVAYEDSDWTTKLVLKCKEIITINYAFYGYRQNPASLTNTPKLKTFRDNVESVRVLYDMMRENDRDERFNSGIYRQIKKSVLSFIRISRNYKVSDSLEVLNNLPPLIIDSICNHYPVTPKERFLLNLLKNHPKIILHTIRFMTLTKRFLS